MLLIGPGCQVDLPLANGGGALGPDAVADGGLLDGGAPSLEGESSERMPGVEPGPYARDARWPAFVRGWPDRVERALDRLAVVTGLSFAASGTPRVVLRAFREETRTHELRAEIMQGRRRSVVHVNIEPLIAGVDDVDRVLLRALAEAAFQDAGRRHVPVPMWFVGMASSVAAGEADARMEALRRLAFETEESVLRVDPDDPSAAEATGLAALALLSERLEPGAIRRAILFVADGDEASNVLGRLVREADGGWARPARIALGERLAAIDVEAWRLLAEARKAAADLGRIGIDATLPEEIPADIADEIRVLRAEASLAEGDVASARAELRALSPDAAARLENPAAAMALRIDVESRPGGDVAVARRLTTQLDRDFPKSNARTRLRRAHPLLGIEEDPQRWLEVMGERIAQGGTDELDLGTLERYIRMLVADHRAGAAEQVLAALGERGKAPELETVTLLVQDAQQDPLPAAVARGRARIARWIDSDDPATARDVRETGRAAGPGLLEMLAAPDRGTRADGVRMLAATTGPDDAVRAVRRGWPGQPGRIQRDLFALAAAVPFPSLEPLLDGDGLGEVEAQALTKAWERLTLGLSGRWLTTHPTFLQDMRDEAFARRREAFVQIGREAPAEATPAFVAYGLKDEAALLRREAAALAGIAGFRALALRALEDDAWLVREEAVRAIARIDGRDAVGMLAERLRTDPAREVRAAAATALVRAAPESPRAMDSLLRSQVSEEAALRDAIGARLAEMEPLPVAQGIVRGWQRALSRREPSRGYLFRTALLFGRLSGISIGYYPGATRQELRAMLVTMQDWLAVEVAKPPSERQGPATRTPAGRGRCRPLRGHPRCA